MIRCKADFTASLLLAVLPWLLLEPDQRAEPDDLSSFASQEVHVPLVEEIAVFGLLAAW